MWWWRDMEDPGSLALGRDEAAQVGDEVLDVLKRQDRLGVWLTVLVVHEDVEVAATVVLADAGADARRELVDLGNDGGVDDAGGVGHVMSP